MLSQASYWPRSGRRWLVCLDLQRDHVIPGRPHYAAGNAEVAAACAWVLGLARRERWRIVHSQVRDETPPAANERWPRERWPAQRFRAPIEELRPLITEPVFFRRGLSAFGNPSFADELSQARDQEVFLIGFSLPDSCLATVLAGHDHGLSLTLVEDAMGADDAPEEVAAARKLLSRYAGVQSSRRLTARELEVTP